jgi:prolyl-tRNA editing enzyme YbaK/EbsC (Cys-tRNA(Pro) deacylase)
MAIEKVKDYFKQYGMEDRVLEFAVSSATVELAAKAVGCVCPFAVNEGVTVYLDESLKRFETVFPACGSSNSAIELTLDELEKYSGFSAWVDVCKE